MLRLESYIDFKTVSVFCTWDVDQLDGVVPPERAHTLVLLQVVLVDQLLPLLHHLLHLLLGNGCLGNRLPTSRLVREPVLFLVLASAVIHSFTLGAAGGGRLLANGAKVR